MVQGRGSSATMLLFCALVLCSVMAHATTFQVGDAAGWTFNTVNWPDGKTFKPGDTLVFSYSPAAHNVVKVDEAGYNSCTASEGSKTYQSGNDTIKLCPGKSFFICTFPGHCQGGMKIAVNAA
ncbi:basic blue protein-like [Abrus precatorius]|uniref:Basic blue protein n=1 Tax=Abrus precatorius TaxID=3816 RepID=A0A8B8K6L1_ABRPR|nr:basic blue protein-like [Abrus precatorius]